MPELPPLVDAAWVQEHLGEEGLVLGDVRGPNAHQRGHLPGSIPLVLGSPPPLATRETVQEFAVEVQRRLGRHGVTGRERLVLYDRGDCVGAAASQQGRARGRPSAGLRARGRDRNVAGRAGAGGRRATEDQGHARAAPRGVPTWEELRERLDDPELTILDVRSEDEFRGRGGYPCDPRQGHIPGARHLEVERLFAEPGRPHEPVGHPRARRPARGRGDRRLLPFGLALGPRRARAQGRRLRRAQLPGLVARVVAPRRPTCRALSGTSSGRRPAQANA
jgi:3-mercaptopyruvate sulfurtransferase SseA